MNYLRSDTTKKVFSNTAVQIIGKVISMSITVLATIIITRTFGKEGFGEFNIMQAFPALFFVIVDFGVNAIATRELSVDWKKAEKYLGNILLIRIVMSLMLMIGVAVTVSFFPYSPSLKFGVYLSLFLILTQALYATTNIIFQVKLRYDLSTIGYVVGSLVVLVLVLILSYYKVSVVWVNFSYVIGGLVTFGVNMYFLHKLGIKLRLRFDKYIWKYLVAQSLPIGIMFVFSQINFKADSILLSVLPVPEKYGLNNTETVAVYGLPYKVFEVALVVPTFFMNAMYPIFVNRMMKSKVELQKVFFKSVLFLFVAGVLVGLIGVLLSPFMISVLGGDQFGESILVLRILLGGIFLFYLSQPISWIIVTLGKQSYLPGIYFVGALFNFLGNIYFIPRYSFYASSFLTWISEVLILSLLIIAAVKSWKSKYA